MVTITIPREDRIRIRMPPTCQSSNSTPNTKPVRKRKSGKSMDIVCNNCGEKGHIYRECTSPTTSYGIIAYHRDANGVLHYLEVNRKFSIAFCEFVRGNYNTRQKGFMFSYLQHLFRNMTMKEKNLVKTETFHSLWDIMCSNKHPEKKYHFMYKKAKKKYTQLKNGVKVTIPSGKMIHVTIDSILSRNITTYQTPEWGFPKGRKNKNETGLECALREFTEETGLENKSLRILSDQPITEEYLGSNGGYFCNKYYIACFDNPNRKNLITQTSEYIESHGTVIQNIEIGCVKWVDYYQAIDHIRDYHHKTKCILYNVHHYLLNKYGTHSIITYPFGLPNIIPTITCMNGNTPYVPL